MFDWFTLTIGSNTLKEATVMILDSTDECAEEWEDIYGVQVGIIRLG